MFDLFIVVTILSGLIIVLTFLALKMSLRSEINITEDILVRLRNKENIGRESGERGISERLGYCKVLSFMLKNFTFLDWCMSKKSKNKLSILVSLSGIANLCLVNYSMFINGLIGIPIVMVFVVAQVIFQVRNADISIMDGQVEELNQQKTIVKDQELVLTKNKILYIVFSMISVGLSLYVGGVTFKNYSNMFLSEFLINFAVNGVVDLIVFRPIGFILLSIPFCLNSRMIEYIDNQRLKQFYVQEQFIAIQRMCVVGTSFSPKKRVMNSPSRIPKALNKQNIDNLAIKSVLEIAKKIKRQKIGNENMILGLGNGNGVVNRYVLQQQQTMNELNDEMKKNLEGSIIKELNECQGIEGEIKNDDMIMDFKKDEDLDDGDLIHRRGVSCLHSNLDFEDDINRQQQENAYQRQINLVRLNMKEQESDVRTKQGSMLNLQRNDQLKINDNDGDEGEIEEIDTNSPQRRRERQTVDVDSSELKLRRRVKMNGGNVKRRVLKYSSGQPYLEYLPNMLVKQQIMKVRYGLIQHKKSQPLGKVEFEQLERGKSFRKGNVRKVINRINYGDQNYYPGTLQVQDL